VEDPVGLRKKVSSNFIKGRGKKRVPLPVDHTFCQSTMKKEPYVLPSKAALCASLEEGEGKTVPQPGFPFEDDLGNPAGPVKTP